MTKQDKQLLSVAAIAAGLLLWKNKASVGGVGAASELDYLSDPEVLQYELQVARFWREIPLKYGKGWHYEMLDESDRRWWDRLKRAELHLVKKYKLE